MTFCIPFNQIRNTDVGSVGGKNASLGEMFNQLAPLGIRIPDGFAVTAAAYRLFLKANHLQESLAQTLAELDTAHLNNLAEIGKKCRQLLAAATLPDSVAHEVRPSLAILAGDEAVSVAVRSSATAEDLPTASFAGQHDSFLNIEGEAAVLTAIHRCYVSLFNDRAIKYRVDNGFEHMQVALSVGVQRMVRSDKGSADVCQ